MTLYKSLQSDNKSPYTNFDFTPYLPKKGKPGKWLPKVVELSLCHSGWHGCQDGNIIEYLNANIYEIETCGNVLIGDDKFTAQQIRLVRACEGWNEVSARLFACDCAEHVLPIFEKERPDDKRPRECIQVARKFARGKSTQEELAAAWAAAGYAVWAAAWDAARAAAWAAAGDAVWDAAGDAAGDAAWAAAGAAAGDAARDAAGDAARDAVWDAARAAAWAAAWDAARAAEKKWQVRRLLKLLK
jgi:hypothetical protein